MVAAGSGEQRRPFSRLRVGQQHFAIPHHTIARSHTTIRAHAPMRASVMSRRHTSSVVLALAAAEPMERYMAGERGWAMGWAMC